MFSGQYEGSGALRRHGRGPSACIYPESAKTIPSVTHSEVGLSLAARRGRNRAAVAVARKLCVLVWHLLMGHPIGALERLDTLTTKLGKLATELGSDLLATLGFNDKAEFIQRKLYLLESYP